LNEWGDIQAWLVLHFAELQSILHVESAWSFCEKIGLKKDKGQPLESFRPRQLDLELGMPWNPIADKGHGQLNESPFPIPFCKGCFLLCLFEGHQNYIG